MTITVKYSNNAVRWEPNVTFLTDPDNIQDIVFNYAGELGSDSISATSTTVENITAGTPVVSNNTVTIQMSGAVEGVTSKLDLKITTAAGKIISNTVRFKSRDQ